MVQERELEPSLLLPSLMPKSLHYGGRGTQMGFKPIVFASKITLQVTKTSSWSQKDISKFMSPFRTMNMY